MARGSGTSFLDELVLSADRIHNVIKPFLEAAQKAEFAIAAFSTATQVAATGQLAAHDKGIEKARLRAHEISRFLGNLARKDENYWMDKSAVNMLNKPTVRQAILWMDQRSGEFREIQRVTSGQLPAVQALRKIYANPVVKGYRQLSGGPTSLHELDDWALDDIETSLKAASAHSKQIQSKLQNARDHLVRMSAVR